MITSPVSVFMASASERTLSQYIRPKTTKMPASATRMIPASRLVDHARYRKKRCPNEKKNHSRRDDHWYGHQIDRRSHAGVEWLYPLEPSPKVGITMPFCQHGLIGSRYLQRLQNPWTEYTSFIIGDPTENLSKDNAPRAKKEPATRPALLNSDDSSCRIIFFHQILVLAAFDPFEDLGDAPDREGVRQAGVHDVRPEFVEAFSS